MRPPAAVARAGSHKQFGQRVAVYDIRITPRPLEPSPRVRSHPPSTRNLEVPDLPGWDTAECSEVRRELRNVRFGSGKNLDPSRSSGDGETARKNDASLLESARVVETYRNRADRGRQLHLTAVVQCHER